MASASLGARGVPLAMKLPRAFIDVYFGASVSGAGGAPRTILILASGTSAGTATADTECFLIDVDDTAKTKGGAGSEMHLTAKAVRATHPFATLKGIVVAAPSGVAATSTLTIVTTATADGNYTIWIHGVAINVFIKTGDTATTQATNVKNAINAQADFLCVTATSSVGVVTIAFRHIGTRGNTTKLRQIYDVTGSTYTLSGAVLGATVAGTGDDVLTTALATANTSRYHYYVASHLTSTQCAAIQAQLNTAAGPLVGKRQQAILASVISFGSLTTIAQTLNDPRVQMLWQPNGENLPCQIAGAWAGRRALLEGTSISVNLSSMNPTAVDLWPVISAPPYESDWVTDSQANSALDVGITPLQVRGDGHAFIPLSITTRSLDSSSNPDTRTTCTNYVTVPDAFADEFVVWFPSAFPDKKLRDDQQSGDDVMPADCTTPGNIKAQWYARTKVVFDNAQNGHLTSLDTDFAAWAFNLVQGNASRFNATMPITPAPWLLQASVQIRQRTASS